MCNFVYVTIAGAARGTVALFVIAMLSAQPVLASSSSTMHRVGSSSPVAWPLFFEQLPAQANEPGSFLARGPNYELLISPADVEFLLLQPRPDSQPDSVSRSASLGLQRAPLKSIRMILNEANPQAAISGTAAMQGKLNYLVGNDPSRWRTQVPLFAKVRVNEVYPGIDVVYYGTGRQLEYDFTITPRVSPSLISFHFEGVNKLSVDTAGELVVGLDGSELRQHRPVAYQIIRGARREVAVQYQMRDSRTVGFAVGSYDHDWPLVIDPLFSYSTFFGGNAGDTGLAIKVDKNGSVYLAGETLSTQFAAGKATPFQAHFHGGTTTGDAFVAKLDNTGTNLLYFTYLGGTGDDGAYDMAIDDDGNAYLTGFTVSGDFPIKSAVYPKISGTPDVTFNLYPLEAFVTELNTNGSALVYSTYLGGSDKDLGSAIAVDPSGNAYVTGYTYSTNFPVVNALHSTMGGVDDAFVAKISAGGTAVVYSTYFGGSSIDEGEGIAADAAGYAYIAGYTASTNFPITAGALQTNLNGSGIAVTVYDAFVAKINPNGRGLVYSTYLGGNENDFGYRIAADQSGNAYLTGNTQSTNFPHSTQFGLHLGENGTNVVNFDAFLTKLDTRGKEVYSAQFGGTGNDSGWDVALDPSGRAFVVGITLSTNFPVVGAFDLFRSTNSGGRDIFVVGFDTNAAPVAYSAYLGGGAEDFGYAIAVDAEANAYISGMTFARGFPITPRPFDGALSGSSDAFVAKIRLFDPMLAMQQNGGDFLLSWPATAPDYVLQSSIDLSPPQTWINVPQAPLLSNGQYVVSLSTTNASTLFRLVRP